MGSLLLRFPTRQTVLIFSLILSPTGRVYATGGDGVQKETKERWMLLCEQAANEQDPVKLMELVREINSLLEEKERRLGIIPESAKDAQ